ncbi:MAG: pyruvate kinase [SAR324 cluster bacterium]|nr:pyruvate kinase [SAR324 cluster bacterium]
MRKTKIICTIGPATNSYEMLKKLQQSGMNIARVNMSHGDHASHKIVLDHIKKINQESKFPVATLLDTKGPEIRTGDLKEPMTLTQGMLVAVSVDDSLRTEYPLIYVTYQDMVKSMNIGNTVILDSGLINLKVLEKYEKHLICEVTDGGILKGRRHVNLPGTRVNLPSVTDKDKEDIRFGLQNDVDFIAMSFVRSAEDIWELKGFLGEDRHRVKIIAKIEEQEGLKNAYEIARAADGIMVARGDLGIEIEIEDIPNVQRQLVEMCAKLGKRVIIATQLLETMIDNPIPTRAEVTDVSNAITQEVDAVMLSGETGVGKYPIKALEQLGKIAKKTEQLPGMHLWASLEKLEDRHHMAAAAVKLATDLQLKGIVVLTEFGKSAERIINNRPRHSNIYAFTYLQKTYRTLSLYWGVVPFLTTYFDSPQDALSNAFEILKKSEGFKAGDRVVVFTDIFVKDRTVHSVQLYTLG